VTRLNVTVNDQVIVSVLDRRTHRTEELETGGNRELIRIAVVVDALALDVFHHEVRKTVLRGTAVNDAGDIRVLKGCHYLALIPETSQQVTRYQVRLYHFDSDMLAERIVGPGRQVDSPHSTA